MWEKKGNPEIREKWIAETQFWIMWNKNSYRDLDMWKEWKTIDYKRGQWYGIHKAEEDDPDIFEWEKRRL